LFVTAVPLGNATPAATATAAANAALGIVKPSFRQLDFSPTVPEPGTLGLLGLFGLLSARRRRRRPAGGSSAPGAQPSRPARHVVHPKAVERLESRRLLSAGDLDPTFGGDGRVTSVAEMGSDVRSQ
jgi:hypothetical protein